MGAFRFLASLLFVIAIPAAMLTSTIRFVFNEPHVYRYAIDNFDAVGTSGLARQDLIRAGAEMRDYFNNSNDVVSIRVQDKGREVSLFNGRETSHLKDVKALLRVQNRVQELSVLYAITYIAAVVLWSREITVRRLALNAMFGSALTLSLLGIVAGLGLSGFDAAWLRFHELVFTNNFYLLNPRTDHLIQMFPPEFMQNIVFFVGLLAAAEAGLMLLASGLYLGATSRRAPEAGLAPSYG